MNIRFPLQFDHKGRTAETNHERHIRDMIEQVLFTLPGERINRPDFGSGLIQLVFESNSNELVSTAQFLVQGALHQWLGELVEVNDVQVQNEDSILQVTVIYTIRRTQERRMAQFSH